MSSEREGAASAPSGGAPVKTEALTGVRPSFLIAAIIVNVLMVIMSMVQSSFVSMFISQFVFGYGWTGLTPGAVIVITLVFIIMYAVPRAFKVSPQEITALYAMLMSSMSLAFWRNPISTPIGQLVGTLIIEPYKTTLAQYVPALWSPSVGVLEPILRGGAPIPWAEWTVPMLYWILLTWGNFFFAVPLGVLVRRRWVEEERLTFPYAVVAENLIMGSFGRASPSAEEKERSKYLLIGVVVSILFFTPWLLRAFFPWFPSIYGWDAPPWSSWRPGELDLAIISTIAAAIPAAHLLVSFNLALMAIAFLLPLGMQFSIWVSWLVGCVIWPVIGALLGYYPSPGALSSYTRYFFILSNPPLRYEAFVQEGMFMFGMPIWLFVFGRRYYLSVLKSAFSKPTEKEREEPLSFRMALLMTVGSFILLVVLILAAGIYPLSMIFLLIGTFLYAVSNARLHADVGPPAQWYHQAMAYNVLYAPNTFTTIGQSVADGRDFLGQFHLGQTMTDRGGALGLGAAQMSGVLNAFHVGAVTKTAPKDVFKYYVIGGLLTPPIAYILLVYLIYTIGVLRMPGINSAFAPGMAGYVNAHTFYALPKPPWVQDFVAGIIVMGLLFFLRSRFVWWPIEPVGVVAGLGAVTSWSGFGMTCIITWAVKTAILRLFGPPAYDRKAAPVAAGLVAGWTILMLVGGLLALLRYFVKF